MEDQIKPVVQEIEITCRQTDPTIVFRHIASADDAVAFLRQIWAKDINIRIRFYALYLNHAGSIIGYAEICAGGITDCPADVRMVYCVALKILAPRIIVAHNRPTGNITITQADRDIFNRMQEIGQFHNIKFLDHIIFSEQRVHSMAESNDMPFK
jgi:DNA repair protein RadC